MTIIDDVEVFLGRDLTDLETVRATRLIEIAAATVTAELPGLSILPGSEQATIYPGDPDVAWTPKYPVAGITSVTVAGNEMTGYGWTEKGCISLVPLVLLNEFEINLTAGSVLPVVIDYDFGFTDLPADVSGAIAAPVAEAIRQQATNPDNLQSVTLGPYTETHGDAAVARAAAGIAAPMLSRSWKRTISPALIPAGTYPGGLQSVDEVGS